MKNSDKFKMAIEGKNIPVLTIDHKWHRLFERTTEGMPSEIVKLRDELNELIKREAKVRTELRALKKAKNDLMQGIVSNMEEASGSSNKLAIKKTEESKRLINEINDKTEEYEDEMIGLPREIGRVNRALMLMTMDYCYQVMKENTDEIELISEWVERIRIDLKMNVVRKQEMEVKNVEIYSYLNDIFGADFVDLFDILYDVESRRREILEKQIAIKEQKITKK